MNKATNGKRNGGIWRRLHRWMGLTAALFLLLLAVTGWLLNHSGEFTLARQYVSSSALLRWYGMDTPRIDAAFRVSESDWLVQAAGQLFLNAQRIGEQSEPLIGAVAVPGPGMMAAAFPSALYLFTDQGELIEKLDRTGQLPLSIESIGLTDSGTVGIRSSFGSFEADAQVNQWSRLDGQPVQWSREANPPGRLAERITAEARRGMLSWQRLLSDLHSGRLFGRAGVLVFDVVAAMLIGLAASGFYLWWKTPRAFR